ncbi:uncharacterized protein TNCV_3305631 [Trichonephila clavipes]|nr:uncharacterized protein TNCV_3305631 [Trichonephila clavipes]
MILVLLHEHYSIHKYHAISHGLKQKHGCPASKAHQLLHVSIYLNQTPWGDYLQSVQDTECFYLRLLLVNVTGPLSFQDIRKVNGQQYPTYKDACLALGLLEDDNQWECMLAEVALNCTAIQIRRLFAIVLTTCFPARAQILWEIHKDSMTDDILHQHRIRCHDPTITFSDEMYNEALIAIEDLCIVIANLPLSNFGMNSPNRTASDLMNTEMNRELQYSTVEMAAIVARNVPLMNEEQKEPFMIALCSQFQLDKVGSSFWMHRVELAKHSLFR